MTPSKPGARRAKISAVIRLSRPAHYLKNGFIFAPLFFAHQALVLPQVRTVLAGFVGFCLAAGTVYVFNDLIDRKSDAAHPVKCTRPLAAGQVRPREAILLLTGLLCSTMIWAAGMGRLDYGAIIGAYLALNCLYSLFFQKWIWLGTLAVATGFVLRVFAGAALIRVPVSGWLLALTFLLALFLSCGKRRCDLLLATAAQDQRQGPRSQQIPRLTRAVIALGAGSALLYGAYTLSPAVWEKHQSTHLYLSTVWVVLGLGRYLQIALSGDRDCSPVTAMLKDAYLQLFVGLWLVTLGLVLYTDFL